MGMSRVDTAVVSFGRFVVRWRWLVLPLTLVWVLALASGGKHLGFASDYRVYFSQANPELDAFEELQATYTKNDNVLFVLAPANGDVFTPETLAVIEQLTTDSWQVPYSTRVDSLTNFQHTWSEEDDLIVEDLVSGASALGAEELARVRSIALAEPQLVHQLVSPTGHTAGVNVTIQLEDGNPDQLLEVVGTVRELAQGIRDQHPDLAVHLTGVIMLNNAFVEATMGDMASLVPLSYLLILVLMAICLRSFGATFGSLLVIILATVAAMGAGGWMRVEMTPVSAIAPTLILTLAVADSVHLLMALLEAMRAGKSRHEAVVEALRLNFQPIFLTSLTTAIGFLSMNSSDAPPLHHLGNMTAVGVGAAFVLSVTFLPALMAVLPLRVKAKPAGGTDRFERLGGWVVSNRRPLLWGSSLVALALVAAIPSNQLSERFVHYFDDRVEFRRDTDFMMENLTGIYQVEYSLPAAESGGISDPEYLAALEAFTQWWREQPEAVHVRSLADTMKRLNKNLHGDDPSWHKIPEQRELAAQYLLLYEMSLPYGLDLNNQINIDKSATRFTVTLDDLDSGELIEVADRGEQWLRDNAPASMQAFGVGSSILFAHIAERNIRSMLGGTVIALVLISALLVVALRSLRYGLLSLIPNLLPAAMGFGLWGLLVGKVGFGLSIVMAMTLGIVVDDTVHFLGKYLRARRELGLDPEAAVRSAFGSVGKALAVTTLVLVGGFMVLALSSFAQNSDMGQLTAIVILLALVADFLLLPPLLILLGGLSKEES